MANTIRAIGIDLGTTNTVAAVMKRGEPREIHNFKAKYTTPSAVALNADGRLLVGEDAISRLAKNVVRSFKRDMGTDTELKFNGRMYNPKEMSTLVLRHVKKYSEEYLGEPVPRAVVTVPAWFTERAIVETREAARLAGFFVLSTYSEPLAAAVAYGCDREDSEPRTIIVYDLGGGTFDISVLMLAPGTFAVMDHEGDPKLGGDDFDNMIVKYTGDWLRSTKGTDLPKDEQSILAVKSAAELAKIDLSADTNAQINMAALGRSGIDVDPVIQREQFESMLMPWLAGPRDVDKLMSTMELVQKAIEESKIPPANINNILLVGGSTYIPLVRELLGREYGKEKILKAVNPMLCVAQGAAIKTTMIAEIDCPSCHHRNPLSAMRCEQCEELLIGEEKIDCPECFLPSPASESTCWKCGSALHKNGFGDGGGIRSKECPEGHSNALDASSCSVCGYNFESGGLKCRVCGRIIEDGQDYCECGEEKPRDYDNTPMDLGIELSDGRFAMIVPKNTPCPMSEPFVRTYHTPEGNVERLEIAVYQGESSTALQNEWVGEVMLGLPKGLPKGTPVDISIRVDSDRTMMVSARLVDQPLVAISSRIERRKVSQAVWHEMDRLLVRITALEKQSKEHLDSEQVYKLQALKSEIEKARSGETSGPLEDKIVEWDSRFNDIEGEVQGRLYIEGLIAMGEFTLREAGEYLNPKDKEKIQELIGKARKACDSHDFDKARSICQQLQDQLDAMGAVNTVVFAKALSRHPQVPPQLAKRMRDGLERLKSAVRTNKTAEIGQILQELHDACLQAEAEIQRVGGKIPIARKPSQLTGDKYRIGLESEPGDTI